MSDRRCGRPAEAWRAEHDAWLALLACLERLEPQIRRIRDLNYPPAAPKD